MGNVNSYGLDFYKTRIDSERLIIRPLLPTDCSEWIRARQENYDYLRQWEPIWDMDHLTYNGFNRYQKDAYLGFQNGNYYGLGVFERNTSLLIGYIEIGNVMGWPKNSATIGYWIAQNKQGQGYMTEAVRAAVGWAMKSLNLIKVEAGTMVTNEKSQSVLERVGFLKEGYSKAYGEIDGMFKDHLLWGVTINDLNKQANVAE
ncbi:MAG: GNAT family protein [Pseudomonadota bacterium]